MTRLQRVSPLTLRFGMQPLAFPTAQPSSSPVEPSAEAEGGSGERGTETLGCGWRGAPGAGRTELRAGRGCGQDRGAGRTGVRAGPVGTAQVHPEPPSPSSHPHPPSPVRITRGVVSRWADPCETTAEEKLSTCDGRCFSGNEVF